MESLNRQKSHEKEILYFIKIHHSVSTSQLVSFIYKLISMDYKDYRIDEDEDIVNSIYNSAFKYIQQLIKNGNIIFKNNVCIVINPLIDNLTKQNYRTKISEKQKIGIWFHIASFESIGFNVYVSPETSDYETLMYWSAKNEEYCKCISTTVLESIPSIKSNPNPSELKNILEKNKKIITRYKRYVRYEQNASIINELKGSVENLNKLYLVDSKRTLNTIKKYYENEKWFEENLKVGVFDYEILHNKIIVPKFAYYSL